MTIEEERDEQQRQLVNEGKSSEGPAKVNEIEIENRRRQTDTIRSSASTLQEDIAGKFKNLVQDVEDANLRVLEFIEKEEQVALSKTEETIAKREQKINELNKEKLVMGEVSEIVDNITFLQEPKALSNKSLKPLSQDSGEMDIRFLGLDRVVINLTEELVSKCNHLWRP